MDKTSWIKDYSKVVAVAVGLALGIRFFMFEAYRIPTSAMRPTLEAGDTIFVAKWPFGIQDPFSAGKLWTDPRLPEVGEVVVLAVPGNPLKEVVRRVLAIGEASVHFERGFFGINSTLFEVKGSLKDGCARESYRGREWAVCVQGGVAFETPELVVPEGHVFVAADNRVGAGSPNQLSHGIVHLKYLRSKPMWIWLSLDPTYPTSGGIFGGFSRIRFNRMFERIR